MRCYIKALLPFVVLLCVSCGKNPYESFYTPLEVSQGVESCAGPLEIRNSPNVAVDPLDLVAQAWNDGYVLTGYSAWNGVQDYSVYGAAKIAQEHDACLLITVKKYERMQKATEVEVWETYDKYSHRRKVNYSPTVINQFVYMGLYFGKIAPSVGSGILPRDVMPLKSDVDAPLTTFPVIVAGVRADSAAAKAGIQVGDRVMTVNEKLARPEIVESLFHVGNNAVVIERNGKKQTLSCTITQTGKGYLDSYNVLREKPHYSIGLQPDETARTYVIHRVGS